MTAWPKYLFPRSILTALMVLALPVAVLHAQEAKSPEAKITEAKPTEAKPTEAKPTPAGPPVIVSPVVLGDQVEQISTIGTALALSTVQVKSLVDGQIIEAPFTEGQMVKKGDVLFRLDPRTFQAVVDQATAALARDEAQLSNAKSDLGRTTTLNTQGYASGQLKDTQTTTTKVISAQMQADQAALEVAMLNLERTIIKAPMDGKTGPILVPPGNLVKANDVGALVVLSAVDMIKVSVALPQQTLSKVQPLFNKGLLSLEASVANDPHPPVKGKVEFLGNSVDAVSGTYELRASVDNRDGHLLPGQTVTVVLRLGVMQGVLTIAPDAINQGQNNRFVYVIDRDGVAQFKPVTVVYEASDVTVVTGDLKAGDAVVVDGQLRLAPGLKVRVTQVLKRAS